jgi:hypothetical protein
MRKITEASQGSQAPYFRAKPLVLRLRIKHTSLCMLQMVWTQLLLEDTQTQRCNSFLLSYVTLRTIRYVRN